MKLYSRTIVLFTLLSSMLYAQDIPINYVAGYGEMEYIDRYYHNRKPIPYDTLNWGDSISIAWGSSFWGDTLLRPYIRAKIDRNNYTSGWGSQYIYIYRANSDSTNRSVSLALKSIDTTRTKENWMKPSDSIVIMFDIRVDSIENSEIRIFIILGNGTVYLDTIKYSTNGWQTKRYSFYMNDSIWRIRPGLNLRINKVGPNKVKLWIDNYRIYAKFGNEYRTLPEFPKSNLKLAGVGQVFTFPGKQDWISYIARHDIFRFGFLDAVIAKTLKPSAITTAYVMTSAGISRCYISGSDTTCVNTKFLGGGDLYPVQYLLDSLDWCFIRDSLGRYVGHIWKFNDTTYNFEPYVRYGWEGETCRNIFYNNLRWMYDSFLTHIKPDFIFLDNFYHPVGLVPNGSPDYETNDIRRAKHLDFSEKLKQKTQLELLGNMGLDSSYIPYLSAYFVCGIAHRCEYGAGNIRSPADIYRRVKFITKYKDKVYMIADGIANEQQLLFSVALFYIVNHQNTYFLVHDTTNKRQCQYRCPIYPKYYYLPIGAAVGEYQVLGYSDTTKGFVFLGRKYTDGLVLVNLDTTMSYSYVLDNSYFDQDSNFYNAGDTLIVNPRGAYILYGASIIQPGDKDDSLEITGQKGRIIVRNLSRRMYDVAIYDVVGRLEFKCSLKEYELFEIKVKSGIYIIQTNYRNQKRLYKVVVIK